MFAIIVAIAAAAVPQYTTPQGNGHHSDDDRRRANDRAAEGEVETRQRAETAKPDRARKPGVEQREADGALMPGAPGTRNPTIPDTNPPPQ